MGQGNFDPQGFERAYDLFADACEVEDDKSGGRGIGRVFTNEGLDLVNAAAGHPRQDELHAAVVRCDRNAVARIVNRMLDRSAA